MTTKRKRSKPFDPAMYLEDDEAIAACVSEALLTGDPETIARALAGAVKARGRLRDGGNRY